jgi:TetR/AcrR family transcriptional regulator
LRHDAKSDTVYLTNQLIKLPSKRARPEDEDGQTEAKILAAARKVFVREGTAGARMQEIAAEAGVNQALLHYYFRSKDRLAQAVFKEAAGRLMPAILALLGSDASIEDKVERFVHLYIDNVRQSPFLPGYILAELHHHPDRIESLRDAAGIDPKLLGAVLVGKLGKQIKARVKEGTMRPISPEQFVVNLLSLSVFPFAARPMLNVAIGLDDKKFETFLNARRKELPGFILAGLRP